MANELLEGLFLSFHKIMKFVHVVYIQYLYVALYFYAKWGHVLTDVALEMSSTCYVQLKLKVLGSMLYMHNTHRMHTYMYTHISIGGAASLEEVDEQLHERVGNGELVQEWTALGGLDGLRHIGEGAHLLQQNRLGGIGGL